MFKIYDLFIKKCNYKKSGFETIHYMKKKTIINNIVIITSNVV